MCTVTKFYEFLIFLCTETMASGCGNDLMNGQRIQIVGRCSSLLPGFFSVCVCVCVCVCVMVYR